MKKVSVIIPISKNIKVREQNFRWVEEFYKKLMPNYELCIGESDEQPFPKAKVINEAVKRSTGDILIIADADLIYDPAIIEESIKLLNSHAWVIPFRSVYNISQESTEQLLKEEPEWPIPIDVETKKRPNAAKGGVNIMPRKHFETVGGFDERFVGWGGEDEAFAVSLSAMCGRVKRLDESLYHLWHKQRNFSQYKSNRAILKKYLSGKEQIRKEVEYRKRMK